MFVCFVIYSGHDLESSCDTSTSMDISVFLSAGIS
jgi:hypothetical protein